MLEIKTMVFAESPYNTYNEVMINIEVELEVRDRADNSFWWLEIILNFTGDKSYNDHCKWVLR